MIESQGKSPGAHLDSSPNRSQRESMRRRTRKETCCGDDPCGNTLIGGIFIFLVVAFMVLSSNSAHNIASSK